MKRKNFVIFLLILSLMFSTGCWDYKEFDTLAMVEVLGFDCNSDASEVTVTLRYLIPGGANSQTGGGGSKSSPTSAVVKATGASLDDALTEIQQAVGKKLFFGYMQEVILGNSAAKQIVMDIIGYFDRSPNIRTSAYLAVTPQSAEEVLSVYDPNVSESPGKNIHNLINQGIDTGQAYPVSIQDFEEDIVKKGVEAAAPEITAITSSGASSNSSAGSSSGASSNGSAGSSNANSTSSAVSGDEKSNTVVLTDQKKGYFKINGMAAFFGDKLAGWLDESQSVGLGLIRGQKLNNYEVVRTSAENIIDNTIIFRVTRSKCKIKIEFVNGKPVADIDVYVEADLRKFSKNIDIDFFTPEVMDMLDKKLADNVKNELNDSLQKGQKELKTDVFAVGFSFYRQNPKLWHSKYEKDWEKMFPDLPIHLSVTAKVIDTGTNIQKASAVSGS